MTAEADSIEPGMRGRARPGRDGRRGVALGLPASAWVAIFVLFPIVMMGVYSFFGVERNLLGPFTLDNYQAVFGSSAMISLLLRTLVVALVVTVLSAVIALPVAYYLATTSRWTTLILGVLLLPYLIGFIPRILSIRLSLGAQGLAGKFVALFGLDPQIVSPLLFGHVGTVLGLLYSQLPVMVILIFLSMQQIDARLREVAADLGAGSYRIFFTVAVPNALPGVAAGSVLVFAASVGAYVEPALMGGASGRLVANIIAQRFMQFYDWGRGSALAMATILMIALLGVLVLLAIRLWRSARHAS